MIKLFTNYTLDYYKSTNKNNDWLSIYDKLNNDELFLNFKNIIIQFLIDNGCIIYGSKAVELAIITKFNNFKMKINDFDVYTPYPKSLIIKLYEIIKSSKYINNIYSLKCSKSRTPGTFTLFINESKLVEFTYTNKELFNQLPILKYKNNLKYINPNLSIANYTSILSNTQTYYQYQKTLDILSILSENFYLKLYSFNNVSITNDKFDNKFINDLSTYLNKHVNKEIYNSINFTDILNKNGFIDNISDIQGIDKLNIDKNDKNNNEKDNVNEISINDLPLLYKFTPTLNNYFFTGICAVNLLIKKFSSYINVLNYENVYEIYTSSINSYICQLYMFFNKKNIKITQSNLNNYPFVFKNCVIIEIDKYKIILYELATEYMYNELNSLYHCSSYTFLISHLLICANLLYKSDFKIYNDVLYYFIKIANDHRLDNIFHPLGNYNGTYKLAGLRFDYSRINNILTKNDIDDDEYIENNNNTIIKINYETIVGQSCD